MGAARVDVVRGELEGGAVRWGCHTPRVEMGIWGTCGPSPEGSRSVKGRRPPAVPQLLSVDPKCRVSVRVNGQRPQDDLKLLDHKASSVRSTSEENFSTAQLEDLVSQQVQEKQDDPEAAFRALDPGGRLTVTEGEFGHVIEDLLLPLGHAQFKVLQDKVPKKGNGTVAYMEFLGKYRGTTETRRPPSSESHTPLAELQRRLRDKIGANLKSIVRALSLVDCHHTGKIQRQELRRVLEAFCFPMSDQEFHKLWSHYCPNNMGTMSYQEFLGKLHVDCGNHGKFVEESARLALNWSAVKQAEKGVSCRSGSWAAERKAGPFQSPTLEEIQTIFIQKNKDGKVTLEELRRTVEDPNICLTDNRFGELTNLLDADHIGVISYRDVPNIIDPRAESMVGELLQEKLSHHLNLVLVALQQGDGNQSGIVSQEELWKIIKQYGLPLSDACFNKLCEPCMNSGKVRYRQFLKILGLQIPIGNNQTESTPRAPSLSDRKVNSNNVHAENITRKTVADVVLKGLHTSLAMSGSTIRDRLHAMRRTSNRVLTVKDLRRILEDYRVFLEEDHFYILVEALGFRNGQLSQSEFLAKYEESISRRRVTDPKNNPMECKPSNFLTAEQCLALMKERIVEFHGDIFTAFRLIDKNRDGLVSGPDFRDLHNSLRFITKESEYQRLLELLGLTPGATLNYPEFFSLVQSNASKVAHLCASSRAEPCDQIHGHLVLKAHAGWPDMAKVVHHVDQNGQGVIFKKDLRNLLYTCAVPITPDEFNQLWLRYDKDGRGRITQAEFLRKLGVDQDNKGNNLDQLTNECTDVESKGRTDGSRTLRAGAKLQSVWEAVRRSHAELSANLAQLGQGDCVTAGDLLALLQKHCGAMELEGEEELVHLLNSVGISVSSGRLSHLDFLSKFGAAASAPLSCSVESPVSRERVERLELEKTLYWVQELVTASAKAFSQAFCAFDKTGSGTVKLLEFRQVLDSFCLGLSDHQYECLLSKMSVKLADGTVNWRAFLLCCYASCQEAAEEWKQRVGKTAESSETHPTTTNGILGRIREVASACRCTLSKEMGVFSRADFRPICDHHFVRLTDDQFESFGNRLPANSFGNPKCRVFLKHCGENAAVRSPEPSPFRGPTAPVRIVRQRPRTSSCSAGRSKAAEAVERPARPFTAAPGAPPPSCELLEGKLQAQVCSCWGDIERRCREVDGERLGKVDVDKFLAVVEDVHVEMSRQELQRLAVKYNITNNGRLSHPRFLHDVVLAPRPPARRAFSQPKVPPARAPMSTGELSGRCADAVLRIQGPVRRFWRRLRQSFAAVDRCRSGVVSLQDFRKVLRLCSIRLSEDEFFHLCSFFDKNISGKISYDDFLHTFLG